MTLVLLGWRELNAVRPIVLSKLPVNARPDGPRRSATQKVRAIPLPEVWRAPSVNRPIATKYRCANPTLAPRAEIPDVVPVVGSPSVNRHRRRGATRWNPQSARAKARPLMATVNPPDAPTFRPRANTSTRRADKPVSPDRPAIAKPRRPAGKKRPRLRQPRRDSRLAGARWKFSPLGFGSSQVQRKDAI